MLQQVCPVVQPAPPLHVHPFAPHVCPCVHRAPPAPQMHAPVTQLPPAPHDASPTQRQCPALQVNPVGQAFQHPPQLFGSPRTDASHPLEGSLSQSPVPLGHASIGPEPVLAVVVLLPPPAPPAAPAPPPPAVAEDPPDAPAPPPPVVLDEPVVLEEDDDVGETSSSPPQPAAAAAAPRPTSRQTVTIDLARRISTSIRDGRDTAAGLRRDYENGTGSGRRS